MTQAGYLSGYADNTFKPSAQITRVRAAAIYGKVLQHNLNEQELAEIATKESSPPPTLTWKQIVGLALLSN